MGLSEQIKDNVLVIVAGAFAAGAALSWGVVEKVRLEPKDDEIALLERRIEGLKENEPIPGAETVKVAQLEAELKKLSGELGQAKVALGAVNIGSNPTVNSHSDNTDLVFGFSQERLAAHLLDLLQPQSEADIRSITLQGRCAGPFVTPEVKVEILAYLTSGERVLRRKAIAAYANCASGVNEAFLLARTIKHNEAPEFFDSYAFAIWVIIKNKADPTAMRRMKTYLVEINAPRELVEAFLIRADSRQTESRQDSSLSVKDGANPLGADTSKTTVGFGTCVCDAVGTQCWCPGCSLEGECTLGPSGSPICVTRCSIY